MGVRRAAIRKLPHELGVPEGELGTGDFTYLTKIHYLAPCDEGDEDGIWGEHEGEPPRARHYISSISSSRCLMCFRDQC